VSGSRHEFVDRENKIILEYKAKNAYHTELISFDNRNGEFVFRVRNGFGEFPDGVAVRVSASNGATLAQNEIPVSESELLAQAGFLERLVQVLQEFFSVQAAQAADFSKTYSTSGGGYIRGTLTNTVSGPVTLTVQAGDSTTGVTVNVIASVTLSVDKTLLINGDSAIITLTGPENVLVNWSLSGHGTLKQSQTNTGAAGLTTNTLTASPTIPGDLKVTATVNGQDYSCELRGEVYTLSAASSALTNGTATTLTLQGPALTPVDWSIVAGSTLGVLSNQQLSTDNSGKATATLTANATGSGDIQAKAVGVYFCCGSDQRLYAR
jgi:hypothetical protein